MLRSSSIVMIASGAEIDDRVITRVLALPQNTLTGHRHGHVGDLQKAIIRVRDETRTHDDIVQQRLAVFAPQRQQSIQGVGQNARATGTK